MSVEQTKTLLDALDNVENALASIEAQCDSCVPQDLLTLRDRLRQVHSIMEVSELYKAQHAHDPQVTNRPICLSWVSSAGQAVDVVFILHPGPKTKEQIIRFLRQCGYINDLTDRYRVNDTINYRIKENQMRRIGPDLKMDSVVDMVTTPK